LPSTAANEYKRFEQCCQRGFNRPLTTPIRGNGTGNLECYLAPGVLDPPCWTASDDACIIDCLNTSDTDKCRGEIRCARGVGVRAFLPQAPKPLRVSETSRQGVVVRSPPPLSVLPRPAPTLQSRVTQPRLPAAQAPSLTRDTTPASGTL
jgi:hypothetical protein